MFHISTPLLFGMMKIWKKRQFYPKSVNSYIFYQVWHMLLILDGNSWIGAYVRSSSVIWSDQGIWLDREMSQIGFSPPKFYFMRAQHVLRYHMIYVPWLKILVVKTDDIILQIFNFLVMFHHLPKSLVTSVGAFSLITCCSCSWNMWRRLKNRHGHRKISILICIMFI